MAVFDPSFIMMVCSFYVVKSIYGFVSLTDFFLREIRYCAAPKTEALADFEKSRLKFLRGKAKKAGAPSFGLETKYVAQGSLTKHDFFYHMEAFLFSILWVGLCYLFQFAWAAFTGKPAVYSLYVIATALVVGMSVQRDILRDLGSGTHGFTISVLFAFASFCISLLVLELTPDGEFGVDFRSTLGYINGYVVAYAGEDFELPMWLWHAGVSALSALVGFFSFLAGFKWAHLHRMTLGVMEEMAADEDTGRCRKLGLLIERLVMNINLVSFLCLSFLWFVPPARAFAKVLNICGGTFYLVRLALVLAACASRLAWVRCLVQTSLDQVLSLCDVYARNSTQFPKEIVQKRMDLLYSQIVITALQLLLPPAMLVVVVTMLLMQCGVAKWVGGLALYLAGSMEAAPLLTVSEIELFPSSAGLGVMLEPLLSYLVWTMCITIAASTLCGIVHYRREEKKLMKVR